MTDGISMLAGRYEIGALIGRGGMSDVHVGTDTRLGRKVAIKLLKPTLATDPKFRMLFREEAQKAARMAHPTIVRVFDAGEETVMGDEGHEVQQPFIVMEHVDGRLLRDIIAEGALEPDEATRIVGQVLTALEYSHRALLVHRDIKPGNIMVMPNGQVKVMDFGIARAVSDNSANVTDTSTILGTAQYFSPEQARGEVVDSRTDLYSTGVVLFEALTGQPPFKGDRAAAVAYQHISEAPPRVSSLAPNVSPALEAVVQRSLAKDKFDRYQTAAEFRQELEAAAAGVVPKQPKPADDFNATLFGVNPSARQAAEATMRQLSNSSDARVSRTQSRPPVAWIWGGIMLTVAMIVGVVYWVATLQPASVGSNLSVEVPAIVGLPYEQGASELTDLDLIPNRFSETSAEHAEGVIIRVEPEAGTRVGKNINIKVWVSSGIETVRIPLLANLSLEAAQERLEALELVFGETTEADSGSIPKDIVVGSLPGAGMEVAIGSTVDLIISTGMVTVPNVLDETIGEAMDELGELGLAIRTNADRNCVGGTVTRQSLGAGKHPQGSTITLTYCGGNPVTPTPTPPPPPAGP